MRLLVWQWGRFGAGPRFAVELAAALSRVPGVTPVLSLSQGAEIVQAGLATCDLPVATYRGLAGWAARMASAPATIPLLARRLRALRLDGALCAMPAPMDMVMAAALRRAGVPYAVVVHDADVHPGDIHRMQAVFQRWLLRRAVALVALSGHVAGRLTQQGVLRGRKLLRVIHPPFAFGSPPPPPRAHGGPMRLLSFGRLLPYKGLDLLHAALEALGPAGVEIRVVGHGPESAMLAALRRLPGVTVENRWVPEAELGALIAWADALVLSHREASQSGVAAAAVAARRWLVATRVGGLAEQLANEKLARLCEPEPAALAAAIASLLSNPPDSGLQTAAALDAAVFARELAALFSVPYGLAAGVVGAI